MLPSPPRSLTKAEIRDLHDKYTEMLRLRLEDAADTNRSAPSPRRAMAALADRFPGALREIDDLPLAVIRSRIGALEAAARDSSRIEPWMEAIARFHALTRGALTVKRWLGGRKTVHADLVTVFTREVHALPYADDARAWKDDLARLARPPRGRVTDLVFERLAQMLGVPAVEARRRVFGTPRWERRKPRG